MKGVTTRMPTLPTGNSEGFTLFELLVVLLLMALAAALVVPSLTRGLDGLELEAAGRDLVTTMKRARSEAVSQQKVMRIILESEPEEAAEYVLANEYAQPVKVFPLPEGVEIQPAEPGQLLPMVISFYPNGRSSGGSFFLKRSGGRTLEIEVDPITGFGRVVQQRLSG